MKGNSELRKLIDGIVSEENAENWWKPTLFERNTRPLLPDTLRVLSGPPEEEQNYNCYIYAIGLQTDPAFLGNQAWEYARKLDGVFDTMIADGILKRTEAMEEGAIVAYRSSTNKITHVGISTAAGKVCSKWSWGPLIEHDLFAVPADYGDEVEFYRGKDAAREFVLRDFKNN